ncbi:hypothetical protein JCM8202v2_000225 [Rhodotorula sphaerocarpa]
MGPAAPVVGADPANLLARFDSKEADEVVWVEWAPNDPENPQNWSRRRKWQTCLLCCAFTVSVAFSNTAFSSGTTSMMRALGCSREVAVVAFAVFPLGFGLGPMTMAPLSEAYGRYPMYLASALVYLLMFVPIGAARNIETVIIARLIAGVAASSGGTLVGGTVADLFDSADRGLPMALYSFAAFGANGLGPAVCGYVELKKGWRWIEWYQPIVASFSAWAAFAYGSAFLLIEAVPLIFQNVYGFNVGETGLVFFSLVIAASFGLLGTLYQERLYRAHVAKRGPEARLYASLVGGLVFPAGAFILAFSQGRGHWMGPVVGLVLIFFGTYTIYVASFAYLADCYTIYASSALSGQSLCRNLMAFAMPLFTTQMYNGMGYQWASFLAGCIALVLAATPFVLFLYGPAIRARSKFAKRLAALDAGQS